MRIIRFIADILKGKWSVMFTLETLTRLFPRTPRWVSEIPGLNSLTKIFQPPWHVMKVLFFVMIVSWFKPQYSDAGSKLALLMISFLLITTIFWMFGKVQNQKRELV